MRFSRKTLSVLGAVAALLVAMLVTFITGNDQETSVDSTAATATVDITATVAEPAAPTTGKTTVPAAVPARAPGVPERAYVTLAAIDAGEWPESAHAPGTKGGVRFMNREGRLPDTDSSGAKIAYQEWDVNPKKPGRSRDAERIVTGDDGSAWYTGDHYDSFTQMR